MQTIIQFSIWLLLTWLITYFLLYILLKMRAKKLLDIELPRSSIHQLIVIPLGTFMAIYYGIQTLILVLTPYIPQIKTVGSIISFTGFFIWLFFMQKSLKKNLIKEGLDDEKSKKLSWSVVSYYFWLSLAIYIVIIGAITMIFLNRIL